MGFWGKLNRNLFSLHVIASKETESYKFIIPYMMIVNMYLGHLDP